MSVQRLATSVHCAIMSLQACGLLKATFATAYGSKGVLLWEVLLIMLPIHPDCCLALSVIPRRMIGVCVCPRSPHSVCPYTAQLPLTIMSCFVKAQYEATPTKVSRRETGITARHEIVIDQLGILVAKLCLKNSLEIREMQAAVLRTVVTQQKTILRR